MGPGVGRFFRGMRLVCALPDGNGTRRGRMPQPPAAFSARPLEPPPGKDGGCAGGGRRERGARTADDAAGADARQDRRGLFERGEPVGGHRGPALDPGEDQPAGRLFEEVDFPVGCMAFRPVPEGDAKGKNGFAVRLQIYSIPRVAGFPGRQVRMSKHWGAKRRGGHFRTGRGERRIFPFRHFTFHAHS